VDVSNVVDVYEVHPASIFRVEVNRMGEGSRIYIGFGLTDPRK
jgi:hypothetical protein